MENKDEYELDPLLETVLEEQMIEGGVPESEVDPSIEDIEEGMDEKLKEKKSNQEYDAEAYANVPEEFNQQLIALMGHMRAAGVPQETIMHEIRDLIDIYVNSATNNMESNNQVISMDKNSKTDKYEHKFEDYKEELRSKGKKAHHGEMEKESSVELDRSSIPFEHLAANYTPEELEELLKGGEGKGWSDMPEEERPFGWGEDIEETEEGPKFHRMIDPDLERHEREEAEKKDIYKELGLERGASAKTANYVETYEFPWDDGTAYAYDIQYDADVEFEGPSYVDYGDQSVPMGGGYRIDNFTANAAAIQVPTGNLTADGSAQYVNYGDSSYIDETTIDGGTVIPGEVAATLEEALANDDDILQSFGE